MQTHNNHYKILKYLSIIFYILIPFWGYGQETSKAQKSPNVVLIVIDDLNDYVNSFSGHPQALTPNIDKLAASGVSFKNAHSNSPICGPSRSSFLTGIYPHNSGNLFFDKWFENPVLANSNTIMEHFGNNEYQVIGTGKIMHHLRKNVWTEFKNVADYGPVVFDGTDGISHPDVPEPFRSIGKIDGSFGPFINLKNRVFKGDSIKWVTGNKYRGFKDFNYTNDENRDLTPDEKNAAWAKKRLLELSKKPDDKPFFMAVGFLRPHTPLVAPKRFFDKFPLDRIQLPVIKENDKNDTHFPPNAIINGKEDLRGRYLYRMIGEAYKDQELGLKKFIQAYLACVAAVDENVGQIMNAIDNSSLKENTIVVLVSDHGFNMGEKEYMYKNALWNESTRVPMIVRAPGISIADAQVKHPVSLIDIYPTLIDLTSLPKETKKNTLGKPLDGFSLLPFLIDPETTKWKGPKAALTTVYAGNKYHKQPEKQHYSVRTKNWRYTIYNTGKEELYNSKEDPYEWNNLIYETAKYATKKEELQKTLKELTFPVLPDALKK